MPPDGPQPASHYDNPLVARYASPEMSALWSPLRRARLWRKLWVVLAETEAELGLPITAGQLAELRARVDDVDLAAAAAHERRLRHDVMAHVHAYGDQCPQARGIIHWGATSCYVTDNGDLILLREALQLLRGRLLAVLEALGAFAARHRALPCLAFTHLQPAQPTTAGRRACLWAQDLLLDLDELDFRAASLRLLGVKGATGTQASFLQLFDGDGAKVEELDRRVCRKLGFEGSYAVTGQTYPRKLDAQIASLLARMAESAHKAAVDLRLWQSRREVAEPFEAEQIGSSAMAYKRNPMRAERMCSLARFAMGLEASLGQTAATQWMERTLDDSALRRLALPQAFLALDAVLLLYRNVAAGLEVYPAIMEANLAAELPFLATENLLMAAVARGGDRQHLHERIRQHSQAAAAEVNAGRANDLVSRLADDPAFAGLDLSAEMAPSRYIGRSAEQVDQFLSDALQPALAGFEGLAPGEIRV